MIVGGPMLKDITEVWDWSVDFRGELASGQVVASATFKALRERDGHDASNELAYSGIVLLPASAPTIVSQVIQGGDDGETYLLQLIMHDNQNRIFSAERRLIVRNEMATT